MKKNIIKIAALSLIGTLSLSSCYYEGSHLEPGHWATYETQVWEDGFVIDSFEIMIEEVDQDVDYTDYVPEYGEIYTEHYKNDAIYYLVSFYMNGELLVDNCGLTHIRGLLNQVDFEFEVDGTYYSLDFTGYYYNNKNGSYFHIIFGLSVYENADYTGTRTNLSCSPSGYVDLYPVE